MHAGQQGHIHVSSTNRCPLKLSLSHFGRAAIPTRACKIITTFILFYFTAKTYAINTAVHFIKTFILFYCTCNYGLKAR